jgi:methyl-accepting chemotaxis protein
MNALITHASLAALLLVGLVGCGSQKKIEECNALVAVINLGVEKVQKGTTASPDAGAAVDELRALADELDGVAAEASKAKVTLPDLKKFAEEYQAMSAEVATSARELAEAVDNVDMEKMAKAQSRMDTAVKQEDPLVEKINKFCQAP